MVGSHGDTVGEEHLEHGEQDPGVAARSHEVVLGRDPRRLRAPGVEHDEVSAAALEVAGALGEVGRGHEGPVGGHRVGAHDEEVVGAVDVGDGEQQLVAEHQLGQQLVRELVHRGGAEGVAAAQRLDQGGPVGHRAQAVDVGVAEVDPDRVATVGVDGRGEPVGDEVERLAPPDLRPLAGVAVAPHRPAQPVRVGVHVRDGDALGTDVPARQRVVGVAAHPGDRTGLEGDLESADGLAEVADAELLDRGVRRRRHVRILARRHAAGTTRRALVRIPH